MPPTFARQKTLNKKKKSLPRPKGKAHRRRLSLVFFETANKLIFETLLRVASTNEITNSFSTIYSVYLSFGAY